MTFDHTRRACYTGYITQAIVNNLAPLLFIVFQANYGVSLEQLGGLTLLNFSVQILTDLVAVKYVGRIGYRVPLIVAHLMAVLGLVLLALVPWIFPSLYIGLCIAIAVYAVGGGLLEVLVSPLAEALPSPAEGKAAAMSLLHSFYCWGQVGVVVGTTLLLDVTGRDGWFWLPALWALVPLVNLLLFLRVPMPQIVHEDHRTPLTGLFRFAGFQWILVLMICAGAAELTMSQWSSLFAEQGLGVSKVQGDLAGPCLFAILMGASRVIYGRWGESIRLLPAMAGCGILCVACYLVAALARDPMLSLAGCAVCGFSVGLLWPGTYSLAAARFPLGGAAMFGVLAVAGDVGCAVGPWLAGEVAQASVDPGGAFRFPVADGSGLRAGILAGVVFPAILTIAVLFYRCGRRITGGI